MLGVFLVCWFTILVRDSRHAGSLLGLLVYYLSDGFKACWESLELISVFRPVRRHLREF